MEKLQTLHFPLDDVPLDTNGFQMGTCVTLHLMIEYNVKNGTYQNHFMSMKG